MRNFNTMKVEKKLSIIMVTLSTLTIILIAAILLIRNMIVTTNLLGRQLQTYSQLNSALIENKLDSANAVVTNLSTYLQTTLEEINLPTENNSEISSLLYDKNISEDLLNIEEYIYNSIYTTVTNTPLFDAIGIYFEPNAFVSDMLTYAFYIDSNSYVGIYTSYDQYANEEYYSTVKSTGQTFLTDPWMGEQGLPVITLSVPIYNNNTFIGVIAVDILIYEFMDTSVQDENYPSLFSAILTNNFDVVFNSTTFDKMGVNISNIVVPEEVPQVLQQAKAGVMFNYISESLNGDIHRRYLYPIEAFGNTWWAQVAVEIEDIYTETIEAAFISIILGILALVISTILIVYYLKKYLGLWKM